MFCALERKYGIEEVISGMAQFYWDDIQSIEQNIKLCSGFDYKIRTKKLTIAAYYTRLYFAGTERAVSLICNKWAEMKDEKGEYLYNIVVITDEKNENDFYLKKRIVRAYLPHFYKSKRSKYINRLHAWHEVLRQYDVDIVVSSMWHDNVTFWDALSVKSFYTKPAFCIHFHNLNFYQYASRNLSPIDQAAIYSICDGVIALTECDKKYISSYNKITTAILNPLTFNANNIKNIYNTNNNIIWCARIAAQKQPLDVVEAIKIVAKIIPDVKLYMVGGAENSQYVNELKNLINKYKLEDNICVVGFTNNVEDYYRKCSLMVHIAE